MRSKSLLITVGIILLVMSLAACGAFGGEEPEPTPVIEAVQQPNTVSAEAFVVPIKEADLSFEIGGRVVAVEVEEGDEVKEGQLLAQLDDSTQQAALAQAQANLANAEAALAQAEASLADVKSGATQEQIAQAEASLARTEAVLAELVSGPTAEDIAQAEAAVETARASLAQVLAGARSEDIEAASARLLQAEVEVRLRQAEYDENVFGEPDRAEPFGIALQQATLNYDAAKAEYDRLVNGPTAEAIGVARAQLNEAQAALNRVQAGSKPEQIAQAQADVVRNEASLAELVAGATDEDIAIAEAGVHSAEAGIKVAEAGVNSAETQLAKTQLTTPFAGVIGSLNIEEGEIVQSGTSVVSIGDTSRWQIETDDLTEIDVVRVKPGRKVQISVDALPDEEYEGEVVRVTPKSETKAGDVTYTVLIDITTGDTSKLKWGMTTFVDIEAGPDL